MAFLFSTKTGGGNLVKIPSSLLAILFLVSSIAAKDDTDKEFRVFANQIGIAVGEAGGSGFSYRHWFKNRYGFQVTAFYGSAREYYTNSSASDGGISGTTAFWGNDIGFLGLYSIRTWGHHLRTLVCMGGSFQSSGDIDNREITIDSIRYHYNPGYQYPLMGVDENIKIGNGIGFELFLWRFSFTLMPGIRYGYSFSKNRYLSPYGSVEAGLFFAW